MATHNGYPPRASEESATTAYEPTYVTEPKSGLVDKKGYAIDPTPAEQIEINKPFVDVRAIVTGKAWSVWKYTCASTCSVLRRKVILIIPYRDYFSLPRIPRSVHTLRDLPPQSHRRSRPHISQNQSLACWLAHPHRHHFRTLLPATIRK